MTCAMALFITNDAFCKVVLRTWPVGQVTFTRALIMSIGLGLLLLMWPQPGFLEVMRRPGILGRSVFDAGATLFGFVALGHMTIANFGAVNLATPLILTLLAVLIFKEPVGWRRWLAIVVGLTGALIVVKPTPGDFNPYVGFAFLCSLSSASRDLVTSRLHSGATTLTVIFVAAVVVMLGGLAWGVLAEHWQPWTIIDVAALACAALFIAGGNFLIVVAFRSAPIVTVAPFRYTLMLWSPLVGFVAFGDVPDRWFIIGGTLIVAAGLYTLHRERVRERFLTSATPLAGSGAAQDKNTSAATTRR